MEQKPVIHDLWGARPVDLRVMLRVEHQKLTLRFRYPRRETIVLALFAAFWCSITFPLFVSLLVARHSLGDVLFPIPHVIIGVSLASTAMRRLFNTTTLTFDRRALSSCEGPVPWPTFRPRATGGLDCFRTAAIAGSKGRVSYAVDVITHSGHAHRLSMRHGRVEEADWIAAVLNAHLDVLKRSEAPRTYRG